MSDRSLKQALVLAKIEEAKLRARDEMDALLEELTKIQLAEFSKPRFPTAPDPNTVYSDVLSAYQRHVVGQMTFPSEAISSMGLGAGVSLWPDIGLPCEAVPASKKKVEEAKTDIFESENELKDWSYLDREQEGEHNL